MLIIILLFAACKKEECVLEYNAVILRFEPVKVYCVYGYVIKVGQDTILSASEGLKYMIGTNFNRPIKANIEYFVIDDFCKYPYCEVFLREGYFE